MHRKNLKGWNEVKTNDSWSVFKIMGEFVDGFENLSKIGPCVSIFGSARTKSDHPHYKLTTEVAEKIVELGFGIITGGGPGIMEAANKGAKKALGPSVGLCIELPFEQTINKYIDDDKSLDFDYFFVRKVMFMKYAQAFVVMPGGFGTLDECMEILTWKQLGLHNRPIVILDIDGCWKSLKDLFTDLTTNEFTNSDSINLFSIENQVSSVFHAINEMNQ